MNVMIKNLDYKTEDFEIDFLKDRESVADFLEYLEDMFYISNRENEKVVYIDKLEFDNLLLKYAD
jgi:hypothetical protein